MPSSLPLNATMAPSSPPQAQNIQSATADGKKPGFSFGDFIDVINPLQHIPVVSTLYRRVTGDEITDTAKMIGGSLFGGAIGLAAAGASVLIDKVTGYDIGEHLTNTVLGEPKNPNAKVYIEDLPSSPVGYPVQTPRQKPPQDSGENIPAPLSGAVSLRSPKIQTQNQEPLGPLSQSMSPAIPTLSPAAMEALLSSVPGLNLQSDRPADHENKKKSAQETSDLAAIAHAKAALIAAQETHIGRSVAPR